MTKPKATSTARRDETEKAITPQLDKGRVLDVDVSGVDSLDRAVADMAVGGVLSNALTLGNFSSRTLGALSLSESVLALTDSAKLIHSGDLRAAESMLLAQAVALNGIFGELSRRAALNMGEHMAATETYMKLALKAQSQSRATLVALAEIRNPPAVFARQVNVANGPQQVNNGPAPQTQRSAQARACAHASDNQSEQSKLLETEHGERMDFGAQDAASGTHQDLAPVGAVNRADHRGR